jgi:hypothetical protein
MVDKLYLHFCRPSKTSVGVGGKRGDKEREEEVKEWIWIVLCRGWNFCERVGWLRGELCFGLRRHRGNLMERKLSVRDTKPPTTPMLAVIQRARVIVE